MFKCFSLFIFNNGKLLRSIKSHTVAVVCLNWDEDGTKNVNLATRDLGPCPSQVFGTRFPRSQEQRVKDQLRAELRAELGAELRQEVLRDVNDEITQLKNQYAAVAAYMKSAGHPLPPSPNGAGNGDGDHTPSLMEHNGQNGKLLRSIKSHTVAVVCLNWEEDGTKNVNLATRDLGPCPSQVFGTRFTRSQEQRVKDQLRAELRAELGAELRQEVLRDVNDEITQLKNQYAAVAAYMKSAGHPLPPSPNGAGNGDGDHTPSLMEHNGQVNCGFMVLFEAMRIELAILLIENTHASHID
ncbi:hypothetical protein RHGRI_004856 [Rhododendron griersonianum]|uniref:Uncharacterized protein n=1 Tax=Rhododendron griersonianum TaxID=479676 RepID=A0AAV6LC18_9ERIC|nr:hypothetical protein RHGRI_004856 [Rhododendron griersonianum]